jgi:ABC-type antimicrobial peptide transport system permease subunit
MNQEKWFDFLLAFKDKPIKIQSEIEKLYEVKSIVGFDILDYSQYDLTKQTLIPSLVQNLLAETTEACLKLESSLFGAQKEEFKK